MIGQKFVVYEFPDISNIAYSEQKKYFWRFVISAECCIKFEQVLSGISNKFVDHCIKTRIILISTTYLRCSPRHKKVPVLVSAVHCFPQYKVPIPPSQACQN